MLLTCPQKPVIISQYERRINANQLNKKSLSVFVWAAIFVLVAIIGFAYVKWIPYYAKAFIVQSQHSIGDSIISGAGSSAPPASWSAAVEYAIAYRKSIWKAMILGLLLGSGVKVLLPSRWVSGLLGRLGFRSVIRGGVAALKSYTESCNSGVYWIRARLGLGFVQGCVRYCNGSGYCLFGRALCRFQ